MPLETAGWFETPREVRELDCSSICTAIQDTYTLYLLQPLSTATVSFDILAGVDTLPDSYSIPHFIIIS
jgi:hypothetical protein